MSKTTATETEARYIEAEYSPAAQKAAAAAFRAIIEEAEGGLPADVYGYSDRINKAAEELAAIAQGMKRTKCAAWAWTPEQRRAAASDASHLYPRYVWRFNQIIDRVTGSDRTSQRIGYAAMAEVARIAANDVETFAELAKGPDALPNDSETQKVDDTIQSLKDLANTCDRYNDRRRYEDSRGGL